MFNGFSAVELLIKFSDKYLPKKLQGVVNNASEEWRAYTEAAQHGVEPTCPTCGKKFITENHSKSCPNYKQ